MSSLLNEPIIIYVSEQGTTGPKGDTGNGIEEIQLYSASGLAKTYRIYYTDGTYHDYVVTDGNGITGIEKTGTSGLIDTYTITFDNGETATFEVENGNGILSIEKISTAGLEDTYRINYTNGSASTYIVTNGEKGDTGTSITSVTKASTSGLVDTYNVNFSDGTHNTFEVTNGDGIASITKTGTSVLTDTYTITFQSGRTTTFTVVNGNGISGITKISTAGLVDTYRITYTNGTNTTFTVTNGNGIASIDKTGTSGNIDTYTITMDNGNTATFTVTNGADEWGQIIGNIDDQTDLHNILSDKAQSIEKTASGAIVTLTDAANAPVADLNVAVEPVQDLHGYDAPWPAGGGKNILRGKSLNQTVRSVAFAFTADDALTVSGTNDSDSANAYFNIYSNTAEERVPISAGTYTFSSKVAIPTGLVIVLGFKDSEGASISGFSLTNSQQSASLTISEDCSYNLYCYVEPSATVSYNGGLQLEGGSSATSWTPYSNICPITGWDACKVYSTGKNLLPKPSPTSTTINGITWTVNSDGTVRCQGTATERSIFYYLPNNNSGYGYLKPGTYLSSSGITADMASGLKVNGLWSGLNNNLLTVMSGPIQQVWFSFVTLNKAVDITLYPQIELGSTATDYEPYQGQTVTIDLGGNRYGGSLDVPTGVLTVDRAMSVIQSISKISEDTYQNVSYAQLSKPLDAKVRGSSATNDPYFIMESYSQFNSGSYDREYCVGKFSVHATSNSFWVGFPKGTSLEDMQSALIGEKFVYTLATPQTYQLTPTEVRTILGLCNIWADTGDVSLTYRADTKTYIDNAVADSQRSVQTMITSNIETSMTATRNYSTGDLLIVGSTLYKATQAIANGGAITEGTNVSQITLAQYIAELLQ